MKEAEAPLRDAPVSTIGGVRVERFPPSGRSMSAIGDPRQAPTTWYVYVLRCRDESLYVGIAHDVARRLARHEAGRGARYTRGRGPLVLLATRECADHREAARLERALKVLPRAAKLALIASWDARREPPYGAPPGTARLRPVRGCARTVPAPRKACPSTRGTT